MIMITWAPEPPFWPAATAPTGRLRLRLLLVNYQTKFYKIWKITRNHKVLNAGSILPNSFDEDWAGSFYGSFNRCRFSGRVGSGAVRGKRSRSHTNGARLCNPDGLDYQYCEDDCDDDLENDVGKNDLKEYNNDDEYNVNRDDDAEDNLTITWGMKQTTWLIGLCLIVLHFVRVETIPACQYSNRTIRTINCNGSVVHQLQP